ncbi:hypothetical protein ACJ72_04506 [Emergomyces africanus]|uniref:Uncharacterized protein n=1 Tax=Emergomyces africanus TaxID=1955775 RepID=A0A1B7NWL2_9EURO|nr:hypothetical protein ACJ72_04506 [Emergomyces africanus]
MPSDPTRGLNRDQKRQLASVLYEGQVIDPDVEQKSSTALFSSRKRCLLHEKLKGDLIEYLLDLIKFEVGLGINLYNAHYKTLSETQKQLVNNLQQLNNMWTERVLPAEKYPNQTRQWRYQTNQCNACIVGRVAQNEATLKSLQKILKARDRPHRGYVYAPPRLLFWVEEFLHCHESKVISRGGESCKLSRSKSMPHSRRPQHKPKSDWIDETDKIIERWQRLGAATKEPTPESRSDRDLECYTPTKITRSLTVARMENGKRPRRAQQQSYGNLSHNKPNSIVNDRDHGSTHAHQNSRDNGTISEHPRTFGHELDSDGRTQHGKSPIPNLEIPPVRRDSVTSLSSNYSCSPPTTPVTEQLTVCTGRYNCLPVSPSTRVVRNVTAVGSPTGEGTGHYNREANFDPDLAYELNSYIDADRSNKGDRSKADDWGGANAIKTTPELECISCREPEDSESEWDDDSVYDSDEHYSPAGHARDHGFHIASPR